MIFFREIYAVIVHKFLGKVKKKVDERLKAGLNRFWPLILTQIRKYFATSLRLPLPYKVTVDGILGSLFRSEDSQKKIESKSYL